MLTESFHNKGDLNQWLNSDTLHEEYEQFVRDMWEPLVDKNLSYIIVNKGTNVPVGIALNYDEYDMPEMDMTDNVMIFADFTDYLEQPVKDKLPVGKGKVLYSFLMGTNPDLSDQENVEVIQFMESQLLDLAKTRGFAGVFTTNTNALTQVSNTFQ